MERFWTQPRVQQCFRVVRAYYYHVTNVGTPPRLCTNEKSRLWVGLTAIGMHSGLLTCSARCVCPLTDLCVFRYHHHHYCRVVTRTGLALQSYNLPNIARWPNNGSWTCLPQSYYLDNALVAPAAGHIDILKPFQVRTFVR